MLFSTGYSYHQPANIELYLCMYRYWVCEQRDTQTTKNILDLPELGRVGAQKNNAAAFGTSTVIKLRQHDRRQAKANKRVAKAGRVVIEWLGTEYVDTTVRTSMGDKRPGAAQRLSEGKIFAIVGHLNVQHKPPPSQSHSQESGYYPWYGVTWPHFSRSWGLFETWEPTLHSKWVGVL